MSIIKRCDGNVFCHIPPDDVITNCVISMWNNKNDIIDCLEINEQRPHLKEQVKTVMRLIYE
jgi:hypothetical protein